MLNKAARAAPDHGGVVLGNARRIAGVRLRGGVRLLLLEGAAFVVARAAERATFVETLTINRGPGKELEAKERGRYLEVFCGIKVSTDSSK